MKRLNPCVPSTEARKWNFHQCLEAPRSPFPPPFLGSLSFKSLLAICVPRRPAPRARGSGPPARPRAPASCLQVALSHYSLSSLRAGTAAAPASVCAQPRAWHGAGAP